MKVLIVLVIIGILLLCSINSSKLPEGFEPINPGNVPCVSEQPILYGDYPVKKDPMVSNLGSQQLWKFYPTFPVGSYKQETNNIKYWSTPNNGTCSPAIFCGGLYSSDLLYMRVISNADLFRWFIFGVNLIKMPFSEAAYCINQS